MIREESAVRAAILDDSLVPDAADLLARLPVAIRRRRRRRVASAIVAVITVVGAITIPMFVIPRSAAVVSSTARGPHALLAQSVREIDTANTVVTIDSYLAGMQIGSVRLGELSGSLYVNDIGATPARGLADLRDGSTPVEVRGRAGFVATVRTGLHTPVIAWEYAADGWAFVLGCGGPPCAQTSADLSRLASAVRFDAATPIGVPVAIGYLPSGQSLWSVGRVFANDLFDDDPRQPYGLKLLFFGPDPPKSAEFSLLIEPTVAAGWAGPGLDPIPSAAPNSSIDGHPVRWNGSKSVRVSDRQQVFLTLGTCAVEVSGNPAEGSAPSASHVEITKIVEGLRLADCSDHATWFTGTTAIPGGADTTVEQHMPTFSTSSAVILKSPSPRCSQDHSC